MMKKYNHKRNRIIKEAKGSVYDMLAAFEDKLQDLDDGFYGESLDEAVSEDDVRELVLWIPNYEPAYRTIRSTIDNLKRKIKRGIYDDEKALKAWENVADYGVKLYDKEYGSGRGVLFLDKETRKEIARQLKDNYDEEVNEDELEESLVLKEENDKKWLNVELTKDEYKELKKFLVDHDIKHEASGAYNLIHVEVYVDEYERKQIDEFLDSLDEGCHKKNKVNEDFELSEEERKGLNPLGYGNKPVCCKCGEHLDIDNCSAKGPYGNIFYHYVAEPWDEEGHEWRDFCDDCWETVKNMSADEICATYEPSTY